MLVEVSLARQLNAHGRQSASALEFGKVVDFTPQICVEPKVSLSKVLAKKQSVVLLKYR